MRPSASHRTSSHSCSRNVASPLLAGPHPPSRRPLRELRIPLHRGSWRTCAGKAALGPLLQATTPGLSPRLFPRLFQRMSLRSLRQLTRLLPRAPQRTPLNKMFRPSTRASASSLSIPTPYPSTLLPWEAPTRTHPGSLALSWTPPSPAPSENLPWFNTRKTWASPSRLARPQRPASRSIAGCPLTQPPTASSSQTAISSPLLPSRSTEGVRPSQGRRSSSSRTSSRCWSPGRGPSARRPDISFLISLFCPAATSLFREPQTRLLGWRSRGSRGRTRRRSQRPGRPGKSNQGRMKTRTKQTLSSSQPPRPWMPPKPSCTSLLLLVSARLFSGSATRSKTCAPATWPRSLGPTGRAIR